MNYLGKGVTNMTKVYFVRHAQPLHLWKDDRTRPLTEEGMKDTIKVLEFFKNISVDCFYSSPYKRSIQTLEMTAKYFNKEIVIDERFKERKKGPGGNEFGMFQKRWEDKDYYEEGGESIHMVQKRNIEALNDRLDIDIDKTIVIGTHGTALSSILNYFDNTFECSSFLRIIDWMPYIVELNFNGKKFEKKIEHLYIKKSFQGKARADKAL